MSPLCSADITEFYFMSASLSNRLLSRSLCVSLSIFYWFFKFFESYLFLAMLLSKSITTCLSSDYAFVHYLSSLIVLSWSYSRYFFNYCNFLFVLLTSSYLDLSPYINYIILYISYLVSVSFCDFEYGLMSMIRRLFMSCIFFILFKLIYIIL